LERLEFNGARMAEYLQQSRGSQNMNKSRSSKVEKLIDLLLKNGHDDDKLMDIEDNFAELFESKLLGFEFHDNNIVPPWCVTHFRFDTD
jgi:hypothetical protein